MLPVQVNDKKAGKSIEKTDQRFLNCKNKLANLQEFYNLLHMTDNRKKRKEI